MRATPPRYGRDDEEPCSENRPVDASAHFRHDLHGRNGQFAHANASHVRGQSPDVPPRDASGMEVWSRAFPDYSGSVIRARRLEKRYGDKRVLRGVEFDLPRDGFLVVTGPNGSGKTTLLRLCAGLAVPSAGELEVQLDRGRVGYLAHEPLVYRELTALENLDLYGRLYRVSERRERIGMLLERFGLWEVRHEQAGPYSRGMLQRRALCGSVLPEDSSELAAAGLLWVAIVFTSLLGLAHAFTAEREQGVIDGLVLAPSDRSAIWLGKAISVLVFLGLAEVVAVPAFALFFRPVGGAMIAGIVLADIGIAVVGTLLAAMAAASRARELLL